MQYRLSTIFLVFFVTATSLAAFGAVWGLTAAGIVFAIALLLHWREILKISLVELFVSVIIIGILLALLTPAVQSSRPSPRMRCNYHMREIGIALVCYHEARGHFPPINICDKDGKPLYNWAVEILPYLDRNDLFQAFAKDEPWNSAKNAPLLDASVQTIFTCPSIPRTDKNQFTNFVAIIGPGTIWRKEGTVSLKDLPDPSLAVMAVECADTKKQWTEPCSITAEEALERMKTGKGIRISARHSGVNVMFADGSVRIISDDTPISVWRKLLMGKLKSREELDNCHPTANDPAPVNLWLNQPPPPPDAWKIALSVLVWLISVFMLFFRAWTSRPIRQKPVNSME